MTDGVLALLIVLAFFQGIITGICLVKIKGNQK